MATLPSPTPLAPPPYTCVKSGFCFFLYHVKLSLFSRAWHNWADYQIKVHQIFTIREKNHLHDATFLQEVGKNSIFFRRQYQRNTCHWVCSCLYLGSTYSTDMFQELILSCDISYCILHSLMNNISIL